MTISSTPPYALDATPAPASRTRLFDWAELRRVGVAVTMMVVLGTAIIMVQAALMGYNSLAQAGPKAIVDGAVIAMLIGRTRRWRTLALLGPVYGLVLLFMTGIIYLPAIMTLAAAGGAVAGRLLHRLHRLTALCVADVVFELLAGAGQPLYIYFGTQGGDEPLLWSMYLLEWPLRIAGALMGVWLGRRFRARRDSPTRVISSPTAPPRRHQAARRASRIGAGTKLVIALFGCVAPMLIDAWSALAVIALLYLAFAWVTGVRRALLWTLFGLVWIWCFYALASFLWHHDWHRVIDLIRTLLLRFMPLTLSAAVIMLTVPPREMVRTFRRWRVSPVILLPVATALRGLAPARRRVAAELAALKQSDRWRGPLTPLLRPITVASALFVPLFHQWAGQLAEPHPDELPQTETNPTKDA